LISKLPGDMQHHDTLDPFEQKVISGDGKVQDSSSGRVWLNRPHLFRWEYGGDFPELVVADGSRIWIYDEMLEQVTVRNQSDAELDTPLSLITDPGRLEEHFEVREIGEAEQLQLLELTARNPETEFERILLGLGDDQLVLMVMEDAFGLRTEIRFDQIQRNPQIDASLFTFEPPESADVIGDYPGAGGGY
jgi:outer membrane lipoprotein carrier protein